MEFVFFFERIVIGSEPVSSIVPTMPSPSRRILNEKAKKKQPSKKTAIKKNSHPSTLQTHEVGTTAAMMT
jgi:hypothetical protein